MRGAKRSAKNTAKNISLLVLCGLMGVLCAVNWLMGLNIAQMPADSTLRRLHDRFVGGAVGYEIRSSGVSAADPAQMALTVDGKLYGVQYNLTDIDAGITATTNARAAPNCTCLIQNRNATSETASTTSITMIAAVDPNHAPTPMLFV